MRKNDFTNTYEATCIKQANAVIEKNFSALIPSGTEESHDIMRGLFENAGYTVHALNLSDMRHSDRYNPIGFARSEEDIHEAAGRIMSAFHPDPEASAERAEAEHMALESLLLYLHCCAPKEQNIPAVLTLIVQACKHGMHTIGKIFENLEQADPVNSCACVHKLYEIARRCDEGMSPSACYTLGAKLSAFCLPEFARITSGDDMELEAIGTKKLAYFIIRPAGSEFQALSDLFLGDLNRHIADSMVWKGCVFGDEHVPVRAFGSVRGQFPDFEDDAAGPRKAEK